MKENTSTGLTVADLRRATELKEQLETAQANVVDLQSQYDAIMSGTFTVTVGPRRGRPRSEDRTASGRPRNAMTMRDAIVKVTANGGKNLHEIVDGLHKIGYKFAASRPENSVGAFLYGRHGKKDFRNKEGKFVFIGKR